jgi:hypothetical protein
LQIEGCYVFQLSTDLHFLDPSIGALHAPYHSGDLRHREQPCGWRGGGRGDAQHPLGQREASRGPWPGTSSRFKKKKKKSDKRQRDDNLVATVERKATRPKNRPTKAGPPKDHFERLLDAPCPHHEVPVKHALKDYRLIKNYVNGTSSQGWRIH